MADAASPLFLIYFLLFYILHLGKISPSNQQHRSNDQLKREVQFRKECVSGIDIFFPRHNTHLHFLRNELSLFPVGLSSLSSKTFSHCARLPHRSFIFFKNGSLSFRTGWRHESLPRRKVKKRKKV